MTEIGKWNKLRVVKELSFGIYLDGGELGEILMPTRYVPLECKVDEDLDVFIYLDSEDRLLATTEKPFAQIGDFALLRVVAVNDVGAFLDWGLPKDLLVPYSEQKVKMEEGRSYVVVVYLDPSTNRIVASAKLDFFLDNIMPEYKPGQEVDLLIVSRTELGYKAIINNLHWGMLFGNEVPQPLNVGEKVKGYVKRLREDEKIDLSLFQPGYEKVEGVAQNILDYLKKNNGYMPITDKTAPETIFKIFGISKKAYKIAIGNLYRKGYVALEDSGTRLVEPGTK